MTDESDEYLANEYRKHQRAINKIAIILRQRGYGVTRGTLNGWDLISEVNPDTIRFHKAGGI